MTRIAKPTSCVYEYIYIVDLMLGGLETFRSAVSINRFIFTDSWVCLFHTDKLLARTIDCMLLSGGGDVRMKLLDGDCYLHLIYTLTLNVHSHSHTLY